MSFDPETLPTEKTIVLRKPVTDAAGAVHTELALREPTVGEMKASSDKTGIDSVLYTLFMQTGISLKTLEQLAARDYVLARTYVMGFFSEGPETGAGA